MIIDAKSITITLLIVVVACYGGIHFIRQFALQIAKENHDALLQMDAAESDKLQRKMAADADHATIEAYAKVKSSSLTTVGGGGTGSANV
jgi:cell division protein FtsL